MVITEKKRKGNKDLALSLSLFSGLSFLISCLWDNPENIRERECLALSLNGPDFHKKQEIIGTYVRSNHSRINKASIKASTYILSYL